MWSLAACRATSVPTKDSIPSSAWSLPISLVVALLRDLTISICASTTFCRYMKARLTVYSPAFTWLSILLNVSIWNVSVPSGTIQRELLCASVQVWEMESDSACSSAFSRTPPLRLAITSSSPLAAPSTSICFLAVSLDLALWEAFSSPSRSIQVTQALATSTLILPLSMFRFSAATSFLSRPIGVVLLNWKNCKNFSRPFKRTASLHPNSLRCSCIALAGGLGWCWL
mmetsp:Transcript_16165/g.31694  ORF Transcript_16165/g.31694 Transcript_16165/m.31694 type:complete len:228 (+) Transcript_16165:1216-1899(+)